MRFTLGSKFLLCSSNKYCFTTLKYRHYAVKKRFTSRSVQEDKQIQPGVSRQELEDMALKILREDPEKSAQLDRLAEAEQRVADLVEKQKKIQDEYEQALKGVSEELSDKEQKAQEKAADLKVLAAQKEIEVAQLELESAQLQQNKWQDEVSEELERSESVKAGGSAVVGGLLTSVPLALVSGSSKLTAGADVFTGIISCALFGVVYRYALRQDINNVQLKGGVIAAFGLTRRGQG
eukprot:TRINITY_DN696_c1_g2_i6.p2 TRINITY_DN696_c1_g2~~TRINITY_DN696_c1_g2_i6.p2  ORF type:complete len:236 (+),score=45.73 TRINITY_DN696_c1_g2_i6:161-868(+)